MPKWRPCGGAFNTRTAGGNAIPNCRRRRRRNALAERKSIGSHREADAEAPRARYVWNEHAKNIRPPYVWTDVCVNNLTDTVFDQFAVSSGLDSTTRPKINSHFETTTVRARREAFNPPARGLFYVRINVFIIFVILQVKASSATNLTQTVNKL